MEVETACIVTARVGRGPSRLLFLARDIARVPDQHYQVREAARLAISSQGYVPALGRAAQDGAIAMFVHTHPGGNPQHSALDDKVDRELMDVFMHRTRQEYFVSLVIGGTHDQPSFSGRVYSLGERGYHDLHRIRVVGDRLKFLDRPNSDSAESIGPQFDRQVRAFGRAGQALLATLTVGVVGVGGTGSAVSEQLIRLGIGRLVIADDDIVENTNLIRIHESDASHVGMAKVRLIEERAKAVSSGTVVTPIAKRLASPEVAKQFLDCDVVFGCTDDTLGRASLSRLAYWYLLPVIDMGFVVDSAEGRVTGLFGRVSTVLPGTSCLICRGRLSPEDLYFDALSAVERAARIAEGYAPGLQEPAPAVVTYTTLVASVAVSEALDRLFGFGSAPPPSELLLRIADRAISRIAIPGKVGHYCIDRTCWGLGDQEPLLAQLWPG
jgi:molybdopterin/thiamine biosynthesis adenylyltransferase